MDEILPLMETFSMGILPKASNVDRPTKELSAATS